MRKILGLIVGGMLSLSPLAVAVEPPHELTGSYAGESVVRSLGESSLVVALDENGEGIASRLFFVETSHPIDALSLRSAVSRIQQTRDGLRVSLPREHRVLVFSLAGTDKEAVEPRPDASPGPRLEVTRFDGVRSIREYHGNLSRWLPPDVTLGAIGAKGLQAFTAADLDQQDYGNNGGGGGCVRSCSMTCGDGSSCTANCGSGQCGSCSCTFGASCSCR